MNYINSAEGVEKYTPLCTVEAWINKKGLLFDEEFQLEGFQFERNNETYFYLSNPTFEAFISKISESDESPLSSSIWVKARTSSLFANPPVDFFFSGDYAYSTPHRVLGSNKSMLKDFNATYNWAVSEGRKLLKKEPSSRQVATLITLKIASYNSSPREKQQPVLKIFFVSELSSFLKEALDENIPAHLIWLSLVQPYPYSNLFSITPRMKVEDLKEIDKMPVSMLSELYDLKETLK